MPTTDCKVDPTDAFGRADHDRVLPAYEEHSFDVEHVLTDNGREFCGLPVQHPYELYLTINQIEHRRIEAGSPESNGFCERFHRTAQEEFFAVAFRKTTYERLAQLQADLDRYLEFYNRERPHQGYRTQGRTPYQAFLDGVAALPREEVPQQSGLNLRKASGGPGCRTLS